MKMLGDTDIMILNVKVILQKVEVTQGMHVKNTIVRKNKRKLYPHTYITYTPVYVSVRVYIWKFKACNSVFILCLHEVIFLSSYGGDRHAGSEVYLWFTWHCNLGVFAEHKFPFVTACIFSEVSIGGSCSYRLELFRKLCPFMYFRLFGIMRSFVLLLVRGKVSKRTWKKYIALW
jgi:hypothetical protein